MAALLVDKFPKLARRKWLATLIVCLSFVVGGIPLTTRVSACYIQKGEGLYH